MGNVMQVIYSQRKQLLNHRSMLTKKISLFSEFGLSMLPSTEQLLQIHLLGKNQIPIQTNYFLLFISFFKGIGFYYLFALISLIGLFAHRLKHQTLL